MVAHSNGLIQYKLFPLIFSPFFDTCICVKRLDMWLHLDIFIRVSMSANQKFTINYLVHGQAEMGGRHGWEDPRPGWRGGGQPTAGLSPLGRFGRGQRDGETKN